MSRMVSIEKSGNNYTVNPNASPSSSVTMYCFNNYEGTDAYAYALTETPQIGDSMYVWYKDAGEFLAYYTGEVSAIEDDVYTIQLEYENVLVCRYSSGDLTIGG